MRNLFWDLLFKKETGTANISAQSVTQEELQFFQRAYDKRIIPEGGRDENGKNSDGCRTLMPWGEWGIAGITSQK